MNRIVLLISLAFIFASYNVTNAQERKAKSDIFTVVDVMPEFPGGQTALNNFIAVNLQYPAEAKQNKKEGTVHSSFIVETDGSISNIKILRKIGFGCDEEVERVLSIMPKWKPGMKNRKAVRVQMNLPVSFSLKN